MADASSKTREDELAARITDLEIKLTYQDALIETLNQCVIELRGEVDGLRTTVETLQRQLLEGVVDVGPHDEKPPHY